MPYAPWSKRFFVSKEKFLCCTDLCYVCYNYPRPRNESLLDPSTFQSHQSIKLSGLIAWLERLTETIDYSSCLDRI
jgi:hypothetical protein